MNGTTGRASLTHETMHSAHQHRKTAYFLSIPIFSEHTRAPVGKLPACDKNPLSARANYRCTYDSRSKSMALRSSCAPYPMHAPFLALEAHPCAPFPPGRPRPRLWQFPCPRAPQFKSPAPRHPPRSIVGPVQALSPIPTCFNARPGGAGGPSIVRCSTIKDLLLLVLQSRAQIFFPSSGGGFTSSSWCAVS